MASILRCSEKLVEYGQLKKQEAEHLVEEIQETIDEVLLFNGINRASEISTQADEPKA